MEESGPDVRRLYTPERPKTSCDVETAWRCTSPPGNNVMCCAGLAGSTAYPAGHMVVLVDPYFCPAFGVDSHED